MARLLDGAFPLVAYRTTEVLSTAVDLGATVDVEEFIVEVVAAASEVSEVGLWAVNSI